MRAHCLQHVSFEGMGAIEEWLVQNPFTVTYTRFFESAELPEINDIDWVIIMGGPMSVNDEKEYPWLVAEKKWVRQCIGAGKTVIGVCLGAQVICSALGRKIYRNKEKEIGWFPVMKNSEASTHMSDLLPLTLSVFHWHGETFDLPFGAELLASSEGCVNQIFRVGKNVLGFQCHLETTEDSLRHLIENCRDELVPARYIQTEQELMQGLKIYASAMHRVIFRFLDAMMHS